ncbi:hypothetical protein Tco_1203663 [Tanacetum coccineum]
MGYEWRGGFGCLMTWRGVERLTNGGDMTGCARGGGIAVGGHGSEGDGVEYSRGGDEVGLVRKVGWRLVGMVWDGRSMMVAAGDDGWSARSSHRNLGGKKEEDTGNKEGRLGRSREREGEGGGRAKPRGG